MPARPGLAREAVATDATRGELRVRLFRYDPERDEIPRYEVHRVPRRPHLRVLDALNHVYDEGGDSLAHRWYCGIKKHRRHTPRLPSGPLSPCGIPGARAPSGGHAPMSTNSSSVSHRVPCCPDLRRRGRQDWRRTGKLP